MRLLGRNFFVTMLESGDRQKDIRCLWSIDKSATSQEHNASCCPESAPESSIQWLKQVSVKVLPFGLMGAANSLSSSWLVLVGVRNSEVVLTIWRAHGRCDNQELIPTGVQIEEGSPCRVHVVDGPLLIVDLPRSTHFISLYTTTTDSGSGFGTVYATALAPLDKSLSIVDAVLEKTVSHPKHDVALLRYTMNAPVSSTSEWFLLDVRCALTSERPPSSLDSEKNPPVGTKLPEFLSKIRHSASETSSYNHCEYWDRGVRLPSLNWSEVSCVAFVSLISGDGSVATDIVISGICSEEKSVQIAVFEGNTALVRSKSWQSTLPFQNIHFISDGIDDSLLCVSEERILQLRYRGNLETLREWELPGAYWIDSTNICRPQLCLVSREDVDRLEIIQIDSFEVPGRSRAVQISHRHPTTVCSPGRAVDYNLSVTPVSLSSAIERTHCGAKRRLDGSSLARTECNWDVSSPSASIKTVLRMSTERSLAKLRTQLELETRWWMVARGLFRIHRRKVFEAARQSGSAGPAPTAKAVQLVAHRQFPVSSVIVDDKISLLTQFSTPSFVRTVMETRNRLGLERPSRERNWFHDQSEVERTLSDSQVPDNCARVFEGPRVSRLYHHWDPENQSLVIWAFVTLAHLSSDNITPGQESAMLAAYNIRLSVVALGRQWIEAPFVSISEKVADSMIDEGILEKAALGNNASDDVASESCGRWDDDALPSIRSRCCEVTLSPGGAGLWLMCHCNVDTSCLSRSVYRDQWGDKSLGSSRTVDCAIVDHMQLEVVVHWRQLHRGHHVESMGRCCHWDSDALSWLMKSGLLPSSDLSALGGRISLPVRESSRSLPIDKSMGVIDLAEWRDDMTDSSGGLPHSERVTSDVVPPNEMLALGGTCHSCVWRLPISLHTISPVAHFACSTRGEEVLSEIEAALRAAQDSCDVRERRFKIVIIPGQSYRPAGEAVVPVLAASLASESAVLVASHATGSSCTWRSSPPPPEPLRPHAESLTLEEAVQLSVQYQRKVALVVSIARRSDALGGAVDGAVSQFETAHGYICGLRSLHEPEDCSEAQQWFLSELNALLPSEVRLAAGAAETPNVAADSGPLLARLRAVHAYWIQQRFGWLNEALRLHHGRLAEYESLLDSKLEDAQRTGGADHYLSEINCYAPDRVYRNLSTCDRVIRTLTEAIDEFDQSCSEI